MDAKWIAPAIALAVLGVAVWNTVTLQDLDMRLTAIESGPPMPAAGDFAAPGARPDRRTRRSRQEERAPGMGAPSDAPVASADGDGTTAEVVAIDFDDPQVRERLIGLVEAEERTRDAERDQERTQMFIDSVRDELDVFAEEHSLDERVTAEVMSELEKHSEQFSVRRDVRDGNLSWFDARRELEALRSERDATMERILGAEVASALEETLWGDRDRRGRF